MKNMQNKTLCIFALLVACFLCILPADANALVVDTLEDITDPHDEFLSFREAVSQAGDGDTITFSEDLLSADEQKVITLTGGMIKKEDYLPGSWSQRPSFTIQGPGAERLAIKGNGNDLLMRVYAFSLSVSGLSFIDTTSNTGPVLRFNGDGTLIVEDCVFSGNSNFDQNSDCKGVVIDSSNSIIRNCIFTNNTSKTSGGALYIYRSNGNHLVDGCTFVNNHAPVGGAIVIYSDGSDVVIRNSTFEANRATEQDGDGGGAIHISGNSGPMNLTVDNCFFTGNTSQGSAGAIYADGWRRSNFSQEDIPDNIQIKNSTFYKNVSSNISATSENSSGGGAIYGRWLDSPVIEKCVFISNYLDTGIADCDEFGGGAIHIVDTEDLTVNSCYLYRNLAQFDCKGGGIYSLRSNMSLKNTSFQANTVDSTPGNTTKGAGVAWEGGNLNLLNCTLASHVSGETLWGNSNDIYALKISNSTFYGNGHDGIYKTILNDGETHLKNSILLVNQGEFEDITDGFGELTAYQGDFNLVLEKESNQLLVLDLVAFAAGDYDTILIGSTLSDMMTDFPNGQTRLPVLPLIKESPARDVGDPIDLDGNPVTRDQRGGSRPQGYGYDLGAYEFGVNSYNITSTSSAGGTVSPESRIVFEESDAEVIVTPYEGFIIEAVLVDGEDVESFDSTGYTHTFTEIYSNHELHAEFDIDPVIMEKSGVEDIDVNETTKGPQSLTDPEGVTQDAIRSISFSSLTSSDIGEDLSDTNFATGLSFEIGFESPDVGTAVTQLDLVMEVSRDLLGQETCEAIDSGDVLETAFFENVSLYKIVSSDAYNLFEVASEDQYPYDFFAMSTDENGYYVSMMIVIADEVAPQDEDSVQALLEGQDSFFFVYDGVKDGKFTDPIVALRKSSGSDPVNPDNSGGGTCNVGAFTPLAALLLLPVLLMFKK